MRRSRETAAKVVARSLRLALLALLTCAFIVPMAASAYISTGQPATERSWYWQNPLPQGNTLYGLSFVNANTGWAAGSSGVVLKTADGGLSWTAQDPGTQKDLWGAAFVDANNGWVAGLSGTIRHTSDAGATWTNQGLGSNNYRAVAAFDASSAICVGDKGASVSTIAYTKNGGTTWAYGSTVSTAALSGVAMATPTSGWAVGSLGTILRTTDGGVTWTPQVSGTTVSLNAVAAVKGTSTAYAVGAANGSVSTVLKTTDGTNWTSLATGTNLTLFGVAVNSDGSQLTLSASNGSVYRSNNGGASWTNQTSAMLATTALRAVQMPDNSTVFTVGDFGTILASGNGGANWTSQMQGATANLLAIWFANVNAGWAVSSSGTVLRTTDAGATWTSRSLTTNALRAVMFVDASNGWAVGSAGSIFHTSDGGTTWAAQTSGTATQLNGVWFKDASRGFAVGQSGVLRVTTDGGATWSAGTSGTTAGLNGIWFADANNGFMVGTGGTIRRTVNGGTTWLASTSGTTQTLWAVRGVNANTAWVVGNAGVLLKTTSGGTSTWTSLTAATGTTQALYSLYFTDTNSGWIGGNYGTLRVTADGGTTWAPQNANLPTNTAEVNTPVRGLSFPTASTGFLAGDQGSIRKTVNTGATWTSAQFGTLQSLGGIRFSDSSHGWIVGNGGVLLNSGDGGQSWAVQRTGSSANLNAIAMADNTTGWMVGSAGAIRKTVDGQIWTPQTSNTTNILYGVSNWGTQAAIAVGAAGTIKYTTNGGSTWTTATTVPTTRQINGVFMTSATTAYAVTSYIAGSPNVIKTTDGGVTWAALSPAVSQASNLWSVTFLASSPLVGYITGDSGVILRTVDGGANWVRQTTPTTSQLLGASFADVNTGWAVGSAGIVLRTTNGGTTWTVQQSGTITTGLRGVAFVDANHGWIVGAGGTILRTTNQTAPTTTLTTAPPSPTGMNGWYSAAPQIALTPNMSATTYYSWVATSGPYSQYVAPFFAPEGVKTVYYSSVDPGGNREATRSATFKGDYTPPTTPVSAGPGLPTTSTAPISWTPSIDSVSGVARYDIYVDGAYKVSSVTTGTVLTGLSPNTTYSVSVVAVDSAGLFSTPTTPFSVTTLDVDRTPLATSIGVAPALPNGAASWYVTVPAIKLASTPTTVPGTIHYSWDSAGGPWSTYAGPIAPAQGAHVLWYYATDNAGVRHDETPRQAALKTDTTPPTAPATVTPGVPTTSTVAVTWASGLDAVSGVDHYDVLLDGTLAATTLSTSTVLSGLSPNNTYALTVVAVDAAGLSSDPTTAVPFTTLDVVRTPLATERTVTPAVPDGQGGWYVTAPTIALTSSPPTVAATTYYSWASATGPWASYLTTLTASQGASTLWYYSHDVSGVRDDETPKSVNLDTDLDDPTQPLSVTAGTPTTSTVSLSWSPSTDGASGVARYDVMLNGALYTSTSLTSIDLTQLVPNTSYSIAVIAVDTAGRTSLPSTPVLIQTPDLDRTPLHTAITVAPPAPDGAAGWYVHAPVVTLTSVPGSVESTIYYSWTSNTGPWLTYADPLAPPDGTSTLFFFARDRSGQRNDEAVEQASFKTDTADPTVPTGVVVSAVTTSGATVGWSPSTDGAAGVDHYLVMRDGVQVASVTTTGTSFSGLSETTTYDVTVVAVDVAGRQSASSAPASFTTAKIDRTPLVTAAVVAPPAPNGQHGWYTLAPTVSLVSAPATVPAATFYSWASSAGPWTPFLAAGSVSPGEGLSSLWYYSADVAGQRDPATPGQTDFKVDTTPPLAPATVSAGDPGTSTVPVSWSGAVAGGSPIDHYDITAVSATDTVYATSVSAETTLTGLTPLTEYSISVVAVAESGLQSDPSLPVLAMTLDIDRTPMTTTATLLPSSPDGTNGWYVTTPTVTLASVPATVTTKTTLYSWDSTAGPWLTYSGPLEPPLGNSTLYYSTHDTSGQRAEEATKSTAVKFDPLVPAPAVGLAAPVVTHDSVTLSWLPVSEPLSGIARYEVWDDYVGSTTGTTYTVGGLTPNTTYPFSIVAVNGAGTRSSTSTTVTIETSRTPRPAAPDPVLARAQGGETVLVNWAPATDSVGQTSYVISRSSDGWVTSSRIATVTGAATYTYIDAMLSSSTRYWYAVSTVDDRGESALSDTSTATWAYSAPTTGRPARPTGLAATEGTDSVVLGWQAGAFDPAVTGFVVTRSAHSLDTTVTTVTPTPVSASPPSPFYSFDDTSAVNGQTYFYRVFAVGASGTVGYSSLEVQASPHDGYAGQDPHVVLDSAQGRSCGACHSVHHAPANDSPIGWNVMWQVNGPNEDRTCLSCHSLDSGLASTDTSSEIGDPLNRSAIPMWTNESTTTAMTCESCHNAITRESSPAAGLIAVGGIGMSRIGGAQGDSACYVCHGPDSTLKYGDLSGFENSAHAASSMDPPSGSKVKCVACHDSHASRNPRMTKYAGYMVCVQCHSSSSSTVPDIWTKLQLNDDPNAKHPLLPQDQTTGARMQCQNCHNTHAVTTTSPLVNPRNPGPSGVSTIPVSDQKDYCFQCHNGAALPTSEETTPWAEAVLARPTTATPSVPATTVTNIQLAYVRNVHGYGVASDPATTTAFLRPDMGYTVNTVLECNACHDPHGTVNAYALQPQVTSAGGGLTVQGLAVYRIPGSTPTATAGYDLRFFCTSCHLFDPATHDALINSPGRTATFPTDCTACHKHMNGTGTQGSTRL